MQKAIEIYQELIKQNDPSWDKNEFIPKHGVTKEEASEWWKRKQAGSFDEALYERILKARR